MNNENNMANENNEVTTGETADVFHINDELTEDDKESDESNKLADNDPEDSEGTSPNKKLSEMKVHFIDVGQADAALIQYDDRVILIDSGDWNGNETVHYLNQLGVKKLDLIVGSHPHADHIGQIDKVIHDFEVDEVWMSGGTTTSQVFQRVLAAIDEHDIGYDEPRAGDSFQIGDLKIDILSPTSITGNLNDDSIVMKLTYGKISFLFTGDAETSAENKMVSSGQNLSSTILKVGHHGSDTSSTQSFIDKVDPKVAIMSVAAKSKYNHPHQSVIDRFHERGTNLFATKSHGTIVVSTNGSHYDISTSKSGKVTAGGIGDSKNEKAPMTSPAKNNPKNSSNGNCIDINHASEKELQGIIYIGKATAPKVIASRPFQSVDELTKVSGIADKKIKKIKAEGKACVQ